MVASCLITGGTGWAAPVVSFTGSLDATGHQAHTLALAPGDYVQGRLTRLTGPAGEPLHLALGDARGTHLRMLAQGRRESEAFVFVAEGAGPHRLALSGPAGSEYRLEIEQQVPRAAQHPPDPLPESPRLRALLQTRQGALLQGRPLDNPQAEEATQTFWQEIKASGAPLVETDGVTPPLAPHERLVTFLWRGARHQVRLFGAPGGDHGLLQRLSDTDVWYRSYRLPDDTVLGYRLAPDVPELDAPAPARRYAILATAQRDPFNPLGIPERPLDPYDGDSLLVLPAAPAAVWATARPGVKQGSLQTRSFTSTLLGNRREIHLYRPPGWRPGAPGNCLVVLFDGDAYLREVATPTVLDNLMAAGRLPPTAAIFITNPSDESRRNELPPNPAFARFLAEELMPWARSQGLYARAANTVVAGASYGGLAAAWAGFTHPQLFGKVYSQSGSFWWAPGWERGGAWGPEGEGEWLSRRFAASRRLPLVFQLEAGRFELGSEGLVGIRDATRHLRDLLQAKGYTVGHREYSAAHGFEHWRVSFADGLLSLLGK